MRWPLYIIYFRVIRAAQPFYRHRKTGFECIDESRTLEYYRALEAENNGPHLPKVSDGYIQGDTPLFEQIAVQPGVFNRLIVYRRHALHSGVITQDTDLSARPHSWASSPSVVLLTWFNCRFKRPGGQTLAVKKHRLRIISPGITHFHRCFNLRVRQQLSVADLLAEPVPNDSDHLRQLLRSCCQCLSALSLCRCD